MPRISRFCAVALLSFSPALAAACEVGLTARFVESAPRDRFELVNTSQPGASISRVEIDLSGSAGQLIFDTADGGTGVEVFQPYREDSRDAQLKAQPVVADGAEALDLPFASFAPGSSYTFSIDVDDRLPRSQLGQIRVSGSEMQGAVLTVTFAGPNGETKFRTTFDAASRAQIKAACS